MSISAAIAPALAALRVCVVTQTHTNTHKHTQTNTHTHLPITAHCVDDCAAVSASDNKKLPGVGASSTSSGDCDKLVRNIEEPSTSSAAGLSGAGGLPTKVALVTKTKDPVSGFHSDSA